MDLILQKRGNTSIREDIAVCFPITADIEVGNENDFGIEIALDDYKLLGTVNYFYLEGTEYGGIVDNVRIDTERSIVTILGRCWSGVLNSRIIKPNSGQDYYTVSGTVKSILEGLLTRLSLTDLFEVGDCSSASFTYQFERYVGAYDGIAKMLKANGLKLKMTDRGEKIELCAIPVADYSELEEWSSSQMDFVISRLANNSNRYVYLVCLGSGDLRSRVVVNLRLDLQTGEITRVQTYTLDSYSYEMTFDYPNAESEQDLITRGTEHLEKFYKDTYTVRTKFNNGYEVYDIGDIVGARDEALGVAVAQSIESKFYYLDIDGQLSITCKTGGI